MNQKCGYQNITISKGKPHVLVLRRSKCKDFLKKTIRVGIPYVKTTIFLLENLTFWQCIRQNEHISIGKPYVLTSVTAKYKYPYRKTIHFEIRDGKMSIFLLENHTCLDPGWQNYNIFIGKHDFLRSVTSNYEYSYRKTKRSEIRDGKMSIFQ